MFIVELKTMRSEIEIRVKIKGGIFNTKYIILFTISGGKLMKDTGSACPL